MLQQILKDMYIDPDVLEALNEDQKKTLFLKMRQEQVRRWQEREDKLEREGDTGRRTKPKKVNGKSVSWLLGRDGDVAVIVIGEVDELSSKFICSGLGKSPPSLQSSTQRSTHSQSSVANRKTFAPNSMENDTSPSTTSGLQLNKAKCEDTSTLPPLLVSVREHSSPPAAEKPESKAEGKPAEKLVPHTSHSPRPFVRTSAFVVRPAAATPAPGCLSGRPGPASILQALALTSTAKSEPANTPKAPPAQAPEHHKVTQDTFSCKDVAPSRVTVRSASEDAFSSGNGTPPCAGRGRVAQLLKAFSSEGSAGPPQSSGQTPTRGTKPPLPTKPSHLRSSATPSVR